MATSTLILKAEVLSVDATLGVTGDGASNGRDQLGSRCGLSKAGYGSAIDHLTPQPGVVGGGAEDDKRNALLRCA